jgi:nicotinate-nucleotide adenylyltransferase
MSVISRRVGLLGGTFDPPHLGHLVVAAEARMQFDLDEVRLLVAGDPWMKTVTAPARDRIRMVSLATADDDWLTVDDRETRRDGPTYTADTLDELTAQHPDVAWYFLAGADAIARLSDWHRADDLVSMATFVAVSRPGHEPDPATDADRRLTARVEHLRVPDIEVSSTMVRERVAAGRSVRFLVPRGVQHHIEATGLYRRGHG